MSVCQTEIIYQKDDFVFTKCIDCSRMVMMYKQAMISFDELNFDSFYRYMEQMDFEENKYLFFDGLERLVIETYHSDVQFTLLEEDFYRLKANIIETDFQLQWLEIIKEI